MAETIRIDGLKQLEKNLRDLFPAIQGKKGFPKNVLRNAVRSMTIPVIESVKAHAPEDPETTTSIPLSVDKKLVPLSERDKFTAKGDSFEAYDVGVRTRKSGTKKSAWYYHFLELGTDKQPAQPFLRPAAMDSKGKALINFKTKLGFDLERIAKKLGNRNKPRR